MTRVEFIVKIFGTGIMYTFGKRDSDVTVNNNSSKGANLYYQGQMFNIPRWHSIEITEKGKDNE